MNQLNFNQNTGIYIANNEYEDNYKQAISARERGLCQLTVCFEFQSRSERRKGHKSCALQMVFKRKVSSQLLRCKK